MDCLLVSCHSAFPSFLMFSLESPPLDVSAAFIASSIIHRAFDRHMDVDVPGHAKTRRPGLSGGVGGSFRAFTPLHTSDITRGQLVAGLFLVQVITRCFPSANERQGAAYIPL